MQLCYYYPTVKLFERLETVSLKRVNCDK